MRESLYRQIQEFKPWNEQEEVDKEVILHLLETQEDIFFRSNLIAHMTASAWVLNRKHNKALLAWHNIYQALTWLGGHADGEEDLLAVAMREVKEESGITRVHPITENIFSLEILNVLGHEKRGKYVPSHLHVNITYLLEADETEKLSIKPDENSEVRWVCLPEGFHTQEKWMAERIFEKLRQKLEKWG